MPSETATVTLTYSKLSNRTKGQQKKLVSSKLADVFYILEKVPGGHSTQSIAPGPSV